MVQRGQGREMLECARWIHDFGVPIILSHRSRNNLSATWAAVGLAMLDRLPPVDDLVEVLYPPLFQPSFSVVPHNASEAEIPEWFGASALRKIRETTPSQEIGFHSYSHIYFGDPRTPGKRARQELERCVRLATQLEFTPDLFVFPRNSVGHLDLLPEVGLKCFRSEDDVPYNWLPREGADHRRRVGRFPRNHAKCHSTIL